MIDINFLREQIIGRNSYFQTPYGERLITYADYTASGRTMEFIEKYLLKIQESYANTHTEDDETGKNMTRLLHKAVQTIKETVNGVDNCYVIPAGTGATGAIAKLNDILGLTIPPVTKNRINKMISEFNEKHPEDQGTIVELIKYIESKKPVVFIGPYEHHSNELMWRENLAEVIEISLSEDGTIDLDDLQRKVSDTKYKDRFKIGSFSAASNVTGTIAQTYEIAKILHKNNAIACFDFAASAPYVEINMNKDEESYYDAVFISPHKFLGGPGSSGVLIINKRLYNKSLPPTLAGGGTVDYVSSHGYDFIKSVEEREMAGTPGILQIIKAALAIELKDAVGIDKIEKIEREYVKRAIDRLSKNPNIEILGTKDYEKRIGIFSFLIKYKDRYLHPRLGTRLLNDLFGIQSRAGCACAGPYGHKLLDIDSSLSKKFRKVIKDGYKALKPGWLRINFHYIINEEEFQFLLNAIEFIANYGYLFISQYSLDIHTGMWTHKGTTESNIYEHEFGIEKIMGMNLNDVFSNIDVNRAELYTEYLQKADEIVKVLKQTHKDHYSELPNQELESLSWFYYVNG